MTIVSLKTSGKSIDFRNFSAGFREANHDAGPDPRTWYLEATGGKGRTKNPSPRDSRWMVFLELFSKPILPLFAEQGRAGQLGREAEHGP